ncbi:MAG: segregation and condensation protein A [Phyllobacterium sp.]
MAAFEQKTNGMNPARMDAPMEALWESQVDRAVSEPALVIDIKGFEGPLDLLLHLARNQRVDLARISVVALVDQYLVFIRQAQALRLELAADYLVMAAWLTYLKSKLLIPKAPGDDGESGEELAATLQFRLKRLEAMRDAAMKLVNRSRLGRDVFARGMPEAVIVDQSHTYSATLYELLTAYASQRQKRATSHVQIALRTVWSLKDARTILMRLVGEMKDWTALDRFLLDFIASPTERATVIASSFAASLEMVREGHMEMRQTGAFEPIFLRDRPSEAEKDAVNG